MAKSKAQRMKQYRERKKEKFGEQWMKKERERVISYYIRTELLPDKEISERQEKNRKNAKKFYYAHKKKPNDEMNSENPDHISSDDNIKSNSSDNGNGVSITVRDEDLLKVKMPFQQYASASNTNKRPKKRQSRALKRSYQRIETLEDQNEALNRKLKTARKRLNRYEALKHKEATTPRSKADVLLKNSGLTPKEVPNIRKQLVYAECISEEVRVSMPVSAKPKKCSSSNKIICGKVLKKYRMRSHLQKMTLLERRKALINNIENKKRVTSKAQKMKRDVEIFLNRDDNSRVLPGKGDSVKIGTHKKQKRVLNDYLANLHVKFVSEVDYKISRATFCRLRPKEVSLVNFTSRSVCLCAKHQNMGFKLRSLKNMNVCTNTSPDSFVDMYKDAPAQFEQVLSKVTQSKVKFQQWKRVQLPNGKERMRIVDIELSCEEFVSVMKKEFGQFVSHVDRLRKQYRSVKALKENLPKHHVLVQMDFSENYTCQTIEEIQSAYWNSSMVTLHPTIVYFNEGDGTLGHKSMVFVSDDLHHNASMVSAIIDKTVKRIKMIVPDLQFVHFWTDSPSSQYRNKSIFDIVCNFERVYGCKATWHYFESGHGKSACDGVGGTAKRNADMAVKQSKAVIQVANDLFAWAVSSQSEIEYQFITREEYELHNQKVEMRKNEIRPVKGTMTLHAVATYTEGAECNLLTRTTTCVCDKCFDNDGFKRGSQCTWDTASLKKIGINNIDQVPNDNDDNNEKEQIKIDVSDYIVGVYSGICYIGQVIEIDDEDETANINFMTESGKSVKRFRWPSKPDQIWLDRSDILLKIEPPKPTGKGNRIFSVPDEVLMLIERHSC